MLYERCKTFGDRPANVMGIHDNPWLAYQLDSAVFAFGRWMESKLNERDPKTGKHRHKVHTLLQRVQIASGQQPIRKQTTQDVLTQVGSMGQRVQVVKKGER